MRKIVETNNFSMFEGVSAPHFLFKFMQEYHPDSPAIQFEGKQMSRPDYMKYIFGIAKGLSAIGVKDEDCVMTIIEDEIYEEGPILLALMLLGAFAFNLRPEADVSTVATEKARDPRSANCKVGVFSQPILEEKGEGLYDYFDKIVVVGWGDEEAPESNDKVTFYTVKDLLRLGKDVELPKVEYRLDKIALVVSTSGSTAEKGDNKGVMLSTKKLIAAIVQAISSGSRDKPSYVPFGRYLARGPYSIITMLFLTYLLPLACGMTILYDRELTSTNIGPKLQEHKINGTFSSGPEWECIDYQMRTGEVTDLSGLACAYFGGAGTSPKMRKSLNEGLAKCGCEVKISNGYGATEVTSSVASQRQQYPEILSTRQLITNGVMFPGASITIRDEEGNPITEKNKRGIVCIKSNTLMDGYYGRPEQTAEMINEHDEYVTYDIGYFTDEDELYIYGRGKDLIQDKDGQDVYMFDIADEIYHNFNDQLKRVHLFNSDNNAIICLVADDELTPDDELGQAICKFAADKFGVGVKGYSFWPYYPISRARKLDKDLMYSEMTPYKG